jgi:hypothetical protein
MIEETKRLLERVDRSTLLRHQEVLRQKLSLVAAALAEPTMAKDLVFNGAGTQTLVEQHAALLEEMTLVYDFLSGHRVAVSSLVSDCGTEGGQSRSAPIPHSLS